MQPDGREQQLRILQERADDLARIEGEEDPGDHHLELVVIRCGRAKYALEKRCVREVQPLRHLTPIPQKSNGWTGLINLRGAIYAVLDLGRYLAHEEDPAPAAQVVIVDSGQDSIGLVVDDTLGADRVRIEDLRPPPDTGSSGSGVVRAMTPAMVPVLDIEAILDHPDLSGDTREESV